MRSPEKVEVTVLFGSGRLCPACGVRRAREVPLDDDLARDMLGPEATRRSPCHAPLCLGLQAQTHSNRVGTLCFHDQVIKRMRKRTALDGYVRHLPVWQPRRC